MKVRMSKEMREIRMDIDAARETLRAALTSKDAEKANEAKTRLDTLCGLYDAAEAEFEAARKMEVDDPEPDGVGDGKPVQYNAKLFYKAITNAAALTEEERKAVGQARKAFSNRYSEDNDKNGGFTVPEDLSTEIIKGIEETDSVRTLVKVEPVISASGKRVCRGGNENRLYNLDEYEELKEMNNADYSLVKYVQKKFGALLPISSELLEDSFVNFVAEITDWLSGAARNTENYQVLYGVGGENQCQGLLTTAGAYKEVTAPSALTIEFLRSVKYTLKSGYRKTGRWLMNSEAFVEISNIKYEDGRSIVQPDPLKEEQYNLFGCPIVVMDDIVTDEEDGTTDVAFGDFQSAYRMFPRREFGIAFTDVGAKAFETDSTVARGVERFDGRIVDRNALVIVRNVKATPAAVTDPVAGFGVEDVLTKESLLNCTKAQLLDLAEEMGVTGVTSGSTRNQIVTAILSAQTPDSGGETPVE